MSFNRSDSRSTMSINCACSSLSGSSCRRTWIDPDIGGERVADFVRDARGHFADGRQPLLQPCSALQPPQLGHVLEREQITVAARSGNAIIVTIRPTSSCRPSPVRYSNSTRRLRVWTQRIEPRA